MSNLICEYCNKGYTTKAILLKHQKTTKKCLEIQNKLNIESVKIEYNCIYCSKIFTTNQSLKNHTIMCIGKRENKIEDLLKEIEDLKINHVKEIEDLKIKHIKEIEDLKINTKILEKENVKLQLNIAELNGALNIASKASDCVYEIAKQPKSNNNNNITTNNSNSSTRNTSNNNKTLNITTAIDFNDLDRIREIIAEKFNISYFLDGQKGIAQFAFDNLLKDENGNYKYNCTDPSRNVFKYKTPQGDLEKDIEAKKLTNYLVDGGIKGQAKNVSTKWYENDGVIDHDRFNIACEKQVSILGITDNNTEFKKELVSLVSI